MTHDGRVLLPEQYQQLLKKLKERFEKNKHRHEEIPWDVVHHALEAQQTRLWSLHEMEKTGGEPDVVSVDETTGELVFCDCSKESPIGRRSICYDEEAWASRKENKPKYSAVGMAKTMGIELLTEEHYRLLQKYEIFDQKTSSWLKTPDSIRTLGGAIFGDFRYGTVFVYHNGAESYFGSRGFRGTLRLKI